MRALAVVVFWLAAPVVSAASVPPVAAQQPPRLGPAGVRIQPLCEGDSTRTHYATAFPVSTLMAST